jgi:uncharacterized protein YutE (UPF0331/DUF86 family)
MRSHQIRRERPTFKTAHQYFEEGSFSITKAYYLSGKELEQEIESVTEDLRELTTRQFPRTRNLEYAILKSHLIIEYALAKYIRCMAVTAVDVSDIRLSFSQKLEVAYLLGFGAADPTLLPTVERLNKIRNQVAHTFGLDRAALDEMLRINHEDYTDFKPKDDRERIRILRWVCAYICGRTSGEIYGAYIAARDMKCAADAQRAGLSSAASSSSSAN